MRLSEAFRGSKPNVWRVPCPITGSSPSGSDLLKGKLDDNVNNELHSNNEDLLRVVGPVELLESESIRNDGLVFHCYSKY